jgi:hypothetical protein|tara:strand:- start:2244 stop:2639 length:396 start_codon:yes stop_codon:yes gene_type:complete
MENVTVQMQVGPHAGGDANPDDLYVCHGQAGEWKLEAAYFVPAKAVAAHSTNYYSFQLEQGYEGSSTAISSALTTATVAMAVGTVREFTLTDNTSREFGPTDVLFCDLDEAGTASQNIEGKIVCRFTKVRV